MNPTEPSESDIRQHVSNRYAQIADTGGASCCGSSSEASLSILEHAQAIGYSAQDLESLPDGVNLGLGCGSPTTLTLIEEGFTVVDLGSGSGIDCFLASRRVGASGKVIGVDMTDAMLEKARAYATEHGYTNLEFRKGVIEELPIEANSVDLVISNCVINLSPEKQRVFGEIARILKPGGRAAISDIVLLQDLPDTIKEDLEAYIGCIAGAVKIGEYLGLAVTAGLEVAKAQRKAYDVMSVLGCSPDAGKLLEKVPEDFDGAQHVASLDLLLGKPPVACCGGSVSSSSGCC